MLHMHHASTKTSLAASIYPSPFVARLSCYIETNVIQVLLMSGNGFHYIDVMVIKTSAESNHIRSLPYIYIAVLIFTHVVPNGQ